MLKYFYYCLLVQFILYSSSSTISIPPYSNIGVMVSIQEDNIPDETSARFLPAILMAIDDINNKKDGFFDDLLPNTTLRPVIRVTDNQFYNGALYARQISNQDPSVGVKVCIGPHGESTMTAASPAFQQFGGVPVFSYDERTSTFGNSEFYPNLLRTIPSNYYDAYAIAWTIKHYFRWSKVSVFASSTDLGRGCALLFRYYADLYGISILSSHSLDISQYDYTDEIKRSINTGARIVILFLEVDVAIRLIGDAYNVKFRNTVQFIGGERLSKEYWQAAGVPAYAAVNVFNGFLAVKLNYFSPSTPLKQHFLQKWLTRKDTTGFTNKNGVFQCNQGKDYYNQTYLYQFYPNDDTSQTPICSGINFTSYKNLPNLENELNDVMYAYDSVIASAYAIHDLIYKAHIHDPTPDQIHQYLLYNLSFMGLTGQVSYSTVLESDNYNIGGRASGISYDIDNFYLNASRASDLNVTWDEAFQTITHWHSEFGIPECNNISYYVDHNPCLKFYFQSDDGLLISDSPPPEHRNMLNMYYRVILKILTCIGIGLTSICIILTFVYRSRRLMKMSQPVLSYFVLVGYILAFVGIYLITYRPTDEICAVLLWFEHVPFQLIFGAIMIKCWRVYNITASLKRKKISDATCALYLMIWISPVLFLLIAATADNSIRLKYVTIQKDQFRYILEAYCNYHHTQNLLSLLYVYDALTLFTGIVWCYLIRNVRSTICNTAVLIKSLFTALVAIIGIFSTISIVTINPLEQSFIIGVVISLLVIRLLYSFQFPIMTQLLSGYELDQGLVLKKSEPSIMELLIIKKQKVCATTPEVNLEDPDSQHLTKYSKFRSKEELDFEIKRLLEDIRLKQVELAFVENMMFVVSESSSHHQGEKYEKANDQNQSQNNNNHNHNHNPVSNGDSNQQSNFVSSSHPI